VCGRNLITGLTSAAVPRVDISSTCKVGQSWSVSPSVDILPFGVTIPASVPQRSEIPEELMNYPVHFFIFLLCHVQICAWKICSETPCIYIYITVKSQNRLQRITCPGQIATLPKICVNSGLKTARLDWSS
jgi:hypothetical protein